MRLSSVSGIILLFAVVLLAITGLYPSPTMIGLTAMVISALVLWQAYAILRDDSEPAPLEKRSRFKGYLRH
jgi:divalent metal cation (Fe/Co/Zn/Cd) transporter